MRPVLSDEGEGGGAPVSAAAEPPAAVDAALAESRAAKAAGAEDEATAALRARAECALFLGVRSSGSVVRALQTSRSGSTMRTARACGGRYAPEATPNPFRRPTYKHGQRGSFC